MQPSRALQLLKKALKPTLLVGAVLFLVGDVAIGQWAPRHDGLPQNFGAIAISGVDPVTAVITGGAPPPYGTGQFITSDAGVSWVQIGSINGIDISMADRNHIWVASLDGRLYGSSNGGASWQVQYYDSAICTFMNYVQMFDTLHGVAMGDGYVKLGSNNPGPALFLQTSNGGASRQSVNDSAFGGESWNIWRVVQFLNPSTGFFSASGHGTPTLWRSTTGGASWTTTGIAPGSLWDLRFYDESLGLAVRTYPLTVHRTRDAGSSWESFTPPSIQWANDLEFVPGTPARVWMAADASVLYSADTGRTWTTILNRGAHDIEFVDQDHGWIVGDSSVLLYTSTGGVTNISRSSVTTPDRFALDQNYPNPFNPATVVGYRLPVASRVKLVVYDLLGREVTVLLNERQGAGAHEVRFDGSSLASGVYVYRIEAGGFVQAKCMLLVR